MNRRSFLSSLAALTAAKAAPEVKPVPAAQAPLTLPPPMEVPPQHRFLEVSSCTYAPGMQFHFTEYKEHK